MQPFNHVNRRKAFLFFLLFFAITTVVVGATVFMSVQVPLKQNEQLRKQMEVVQNERNTIEVFLSKMNATSNLLDSLDKKDANLALIDRKIESKLAEMASIIDKDSSSVRDLYFGIETNLDKIHAAKKQLRDAINQDVDLGTLKQQNSQLQEQLAKSEANEKFLQSQITVMMSNIK